MKKFIALIVMVFIASVSFATETTEFMTSIKTADMLNQILSGTWLHSFTALSLLVMTVTELLKPRFEKLESRWLAIIVAVLSVMLLVVLDLAFDVVTSVSSLTIIQKVLYTAVLSLTASGIFSTHMGKQILVSLKIRDKDKDETDKLEK